jgi:hypothetical protein
MMPLFLAVLIELPHPDDMVNLASDTLLSVTTKELGRE